MGDFFHGFQVALMMTVMLNLTQFVYWRCKQSRRGSCLQVHTPTLWTLLATVFVNIQPMWILVVVLRCERRLPNWIQLSPVGWGGPESLQQTSRLVRQGRQRILGF